MQNLDKGMFYTEVMRVYINLKVKTKINWGDVPKTIE